MQMSSLSSQAAVQTLTYAPPLATMATALGFRMSGSAAVAAADISFGKLEPDRNINLRVKRRKGTD